MKKITKKELIEILKSLQGSSDPEHAHGVADNALLQYIHDNEVYELYDSIDKWYA